MPTQQEIDNDIAMLDRLATLMDSRFTIPGTKTKYGLDSLIGLIPGIGDTITLAIAVFIIGKASYYDLPWYIKGKMIWHAFIDWLIGIIPLFGDIFDIGYKANKKNLALLREHLNHHQKNA